MPCDLRVHDVFFVFFFFFLYAIRDLTWYPPYVFFPLLQTIKLTEIMEAAYNKIAAESRAGARISYAKPALLAMWEWADARDPQDRDRIKKVLNNSQHIINRKGKLFPGGELLFRASLRPLVFPFMVETHRPLVL